MDIIDDINKERAILFKAAYRNDHIEEYTKIVENAIDSLGLRYCTAESMMWSAFGSTGLWTGTPTSVMKKDIKKSISPNRDGMSRHDMLCILNQIHPHKPCETHRACLGFELSNMTDMEFSELKFILELQHGEIIFHPQK